VCGNAALVAGFCGENGACARAAKAVQAGESDPAVIALLCDGLVVKNGVVYELFGRMAERLPAREGFATHGSGHSEAAAFLRGRGAWADADIRAALRYVSKVRGDCGDGVDHAG
jgi:hypothetical protein